RGIQRDEALWRSDRDAQHAAAGRPGVALHAVPHHRALLADPLVPADGAQRHQQRHGLHHRSLDGLPGSNGRIPFENGLVSEGLVKQGWNTYAIGKWHLTPAEESNMASTKSHWPLGRGFERYYGFLGGEHDQWYPDLVYDNHPEDQPYTPKEGYHL